MASGESDIFDALGHPIRRRILQEMADGKLTSPSEMARVIDKRLVVVSYHFRVLRQAKTILLVDTEPRRGATEHFYRMTLKESWAREALGLAKS